MWIRPSSTLSAPPPPSRRGGGDDNAAVLGTHSFTRSSAAPIPHPFVGKAHRTKFDYPSSSDREEESLSLFLSPVHIIYRPARSVGLVGQLLLLSSSSSSLLLLLHAGSCRCISPPFLPRSSSSPSLLLLLLLLLLPPLPLRFSSLLCIAQIMQ